MGTLTKPIEYLSQDILRFVFPANVIPTWTVTNSSPPNETISVPEYTNTELADAYAQYLAWLPTQAAEEAAAEAAEAQQVIDLINQSDAAGSTAASLLTEGGRAYLRRDDWVTGADDVYGAYSNANHSERADDETKPQFEWEHIGIFLPAGRKLGNMTIAGRTNSTSISELEIYVGLKEPNPLTRWETGFDNDSEVQMIDLYQDYFMNPSNGPAFGGNMADIHRRTFALDHTVQNDSFFMLYMRAPFYNSSSTRYFYHTWTLEVY